METGAVYELPVGRHFSIDERGVALRATWHLDQGFVNVSLWRDDRCSETFHLAPAEAAELVSFLVTGLAGAAGATSAMASERLRVVPPPPPLTTRLRLRLSDALDEVAARLRPQP